jgi:hypothetical protein
MVSGLDAELGGERLHRRWCGPRRLPVAMSGCVEWASTALTRRWAVSAWTSVWAGDLGVALGDMRPRRERVTPRRQHPAHRAGIDEELDGGQPLDGKLRQLRPFAACRTTKLVGRRGQSFGYALRSERQHIFYISSLSSNAK